jgi:hypothetical protein
MDRAAAFEAEGRGFESLQARHLSRCRQSMRKLWWAAVVLLLPLPAKASGLEKELKELAAR